MPNESMVAKATGLGDISDIQARQLTASVARGDEAAFQLLYDLYHARLTRFTLVLARGDEQIAIETVQSTFLVAAQKMKSLESEAHLWNWLARVARQSVAKIWRGRGQEPIAIPETELDILAAEPPQDARLEECLNMALLNLDPQDRQAVELHYFKDMSHKEIAERMHATPKAVSSRLERARARLRCIVKELLSNET